MKPDKNSREFENAVSVDLMRRSDKYTIDNFTPSKALMLRAAQGVLDSAEWNGKKIAIICGSGNNGGDGYALAGLLVKQGIVPNIYRTSEKLSDDGRYYYNICTELGVPTELYNENIPLEQFDIIVDCILGTGFSGEPRGLAAQAI